MELKQILARQPGPEIAEQLCVYQQNLKEKTKQMKVITFSNCFACQNMFALQNFIGSSRYSLRFSSEFSSIFYY